MKCKVKSLILLTLMSTLLMGALFQSFVRQHFVTPNAKPTSVFYQDLLPGRIHAGSDLSEFNQISGTDEDPVNVFVLSYQRSGSTFIGGIFNDSKNIFYIYEPLDPVYAAMYGVEDGWVVPSDIFNNINGSLRSFPEIEIHAVYWAMERIFTCNMASLPPAVLAHKFWTLFNPEMTHSKGYLACLEAHNLEPGEILQVCQRFIRHRCGKRFRKTWQRQESCRKVLWGEELVTDPSQFTPNANKYRHSTFYASIPSDFKMYFRCLTRVEPVLSKCAAKHFDEPCKAKKLRVIKTVRANMQVGELLLKSDSNSYLIHLYRDPRGAVRSRMRIYWTWGLANNNSALYQAKVYCSQVLSDIKRRLALERQGYASRIKEIVYDRFSEDPLSNLLEIYRFIGRRPSVELAQRYRLRSNKTTPKSHAEKWKKHLKPADIVDINSACSDFFKETSFNWSK